jgi:hypothetical protein
MLKKPEEKTPYLWRNKDKNYNHFSSEPISARRKWRSGIYKLFREKNPLKTLASCKIILQASHSGSYL